MTYRAFSPARARARTHTHTHTYYFTVIIHNAQYVKQSSTLNLLKYAVFQAFNSA
jgi:hypothetical protein